MIFSTGSSTAALVFQPQLDTIPPRRRQGLHNKVVEVLVSLFSYLR